MADNFNIDDLDKALDDDLLNETAEEEEDDILGDLKQQLSGLKKAQQVDASIGKPKKSDILGDLQKELAGIRKGMPVQDVKIIDRGKDDATMWPVMKEGFKNLGRYAIKTVGGIMNEYNLTGDEIKDLQKLGLYTDVDPNKKDQVVETIMGAAEVSWLKANKKVLHDMTYMDQVVMMIPQVGTQVALSIASRGRRFIPMSFMGTQIMGGKIDQLTQEGVSLHTATKAGFVDALWQMPLEQLGIDKATKAWKFKTAIANRVKTILSAAGSEGMTEAIQVLPERITELMAKDPDLKVLRAIWDTLSHPETYKQMGIEGSIGAIFGFGISASGTVFSKSLDEASKEVTEDDLTKETTPAKPKKTPTSANEIAEPPRFLTEEETATIPPELVELQGGPRTAPSRSSNIPEDVVDEVAPVSDLTIEEAGASPEQLDATPTEVDVVEQSAVKEGVTAPEVVSTPQGEVEVQATAPPTLPYHMFGSTKKEQLPVTELTKAQRLAEKKKGVEYLDDENGLPQQKAAIRDRLAEIEDAERQQAERVAEGRKEKSTEINMTPEQEKAFGTKNKKSGKSPFDLLQKKIANAIKRNFKGATDSDQEEIASRALIKGSQYYAKHDSVKGWKPVDELKKALADVKAEEQGTSRATDPKELITIVSDSTLTEGKVPNQGLLDEQALSDKKYDKMRAILKKEKAGEALTAEESIFKLQNIEMTAGTVDNRVEFMMRKRADDLANAQAMTELTAREAAQAAKGKEVPSVQESSRTAKARLEEQPGSVTLGMKDPMKVAAPSTSASEGRVDVDVNKMRSDEATAEIEGVISAEGGYRVQWRGQSVGTKTGDKTYKKKADAHKRFKALQREAAKKRKAYAAQKAADKAKAAAERAKIKTAEPVTKAPADKPIITTKKRTVKRKNLPSYTITKIAQKKGETSVKEQQESQKTVKEEAEVKRNRAKVRERVVSLKAKRGKVPMTFSRFADLKRSSIEEAQRLGADNPNRAVAMRSLQNKWKRFMDNAMKEMDLRTEFDMVIPDDLYNIVDTYQTEANFYKAAADIAEGNYPETMSRDKVRAFQKRKIKAKRALLKPKKVQPTKAEQVKKLVDKPKKKTVVLRSTGAKQATVDKMAKTNKLVDETIEQLKKAEEGNETLDFSQGDDPVKAATKTAKDILSNEKGEENIFFASGAKAAAKMADWIKSIRATMDLGSKLKAMGATKTASSIRNYYSAISEKEVSGEQETRRMLAAYASMNDDMSRQAMADVVLALDDERYYSELSADRRTEIDPALKIFRNFFENARTTLNQRLGKEIGFVQNKLAELQARADEARTPEQRQKVINSMALWEDMRHVRFTHIPLQIVLERAEKKMRTKNLTDREKRNIRKKFKTASESLKKRHVRSIAQMLKQKDSAFKITDFNPVEIMMAYQSKFAKDMAMLDIRDAMRNDGLVKEMYNEKGKKNNRPKDFEDTLGKDFGLLQDHYINAAAKDAIDNVLGVKDPQTKWDKFMAITKMSAFYNPIFLPMYDAYQSVFIGGSLLHNPVKAIPNMVRAVSSTLTKDFHYKQAMANGLFSKPFNMTWESYKQQMDRMLAGKGEGGLSGAIKDFGRIAVQHTKDVKHGSVIKGLYHASWHLAWRMDETVRMFTYMQLQDSKIVKGMKPQEAAEVAARFHGDYANVPPRTRQKLNRFLFTPTFKIAMGTMYGNLVTGAMRTVVGSGSKMDKAYTVGLATLAGSTIAFDAVMRSLGWEPEDDKWYNFGRRYTRTVRGEFGMPRQITFTWSNPGNIVQRFAQRIATEAKNEASGDKAFPIALFDAFKYELHPVFRTAMDMYRGKTATGEDIWNKNDDAVEIRMRQIAYMINNVIKMTENMDTVLERLGTSGDKNIFHPELESQSRREAEQWAKSQGKIFDWITTSWLSVASVSTKSTKKQRIGWDMKRLVKDHRTSQRKYFLQHKKLNKEWMRNMLEELKKKEKEYRRSK